MKKSQLLIVALSISSLVSCSSLFGCSSQSTKSATVSLRQSHSEEIEQCKSLLQDLREKLSNIKVENYANETEYKLQIQKSEQLINELSDKLAALEFQNNDVIKPEQDNSTNKPFSYIIENDLITITSYNGQETAVTVPSTINGLPVIVIGEGAFRGTEVKKVTLPDSITHVDWFAFANCTSLSEIVIPTSVKSVAYGAFDNCAPSLTIICSKNSYIYKYAVSFGISVRQN